MTIGTQCGACSHGRSPALVSGGLTLGILHMVYIDNSPYSDSSFITNSSLNCSRTFGKTQERSGQIGYLYKHQLTSAHSHASQCMVSFTILVAHLDMHLHTNPAPSVRKLNGESKVNQHSCMERETTGTWRKES